MLSTSNRYIVYKIEDTVLPFEKMQMRKKILVVVAKFLMQKKYKGEFKVGYKWLPKIIVDLYLKSIKSD